MKAVEKTAAARAVRPTYHWARAAAIMSGTLTLALCLFVFLADHATGNQASHFAWIPAQTASQVADVGEGAVPLAAQIDVRTVEITRGDTLLGILTDEGVSPDDARAVSSALTPVYDAADLRGGQSITLTFDAPSTAHPVPLLRTVAFKPSVERDVQVVRTTDGAFEAKEFVKELKAVGARAQGTIKGSLYQSAKDAGVPDGVIVELIRIYSHAVDFQREIREGDTFDILYTKYTDVSGETLKSGAIDYAQLALSGETKPLYRFTSQEDQTTDYYTPQGHSGRRLLMRTPIDGARLTSGYGMRTHPVLGYTKMHKGVDFAAPTGTPIMAAGNGVVRLAGWFGTFGKYVRIKHANSYETAYAHMSRIAPGVQDGARVRQGQIIGYVGTTGRSTGPHLHYEVMADASQINPMDVRLPTGAMLSGEDLETFKASVNKVNAVLDNWGQAPALVAQGEILRAKLLP